MLVHIDHELFQQADLEHAVEMIEHHDSPRNVFQSVLESAAHLSGEGNSSGDLVNALSSNEELTNVSVFSINLRGR